MITKFSELHTLIIYIVFGYTLLLPLALISLRVFDIRRPVQRLRIYLLTFLTPIIAFILYHTVLVKRCASGLAPIWSESAFHMLCAVSEGMLRFFGPFLGLLTFFAVFKAFAAVLMVKRIEGKAVTADSEVSGTIETIVAEKSKQLGLIPPRVIFSRRDDTAAFTTGFIKPVIVINESLCGLLEHKEIEAVISHELIHIRQRDTIKNWLLYLVRDIALLNPLSSLLLKGYLLEKEVACDRKAALLADLKPQEYAAILLKVWRSILDRESTGLAIVSSFTGGSDMERRVEALLDRNGEHVKKSGLVTFLIGFFLFAVTLLFLGLVC